MMNKLNKVLEAVNGDILMDMVHEVNNWDGSLDYLQYIDMDLFDNYLSGLSPIEIANRIYFGNFNPNDSYFKFNAYGNLESYKGYEVLEDLKNYKGEIVGRFIELYEDGILDSYYQEVLDILNGDTDNTGK